MKKERKVLKNVLWVLALFVVATVAVGGRYHHKYSDSATAEIMEESVRGGSAAPDIYLSNGSYMTQDAVCVEEDCDDAWEEEACYDTGYSESGDYGSGSPMAPAEPAESVQSNNQKLITTVYLSVETDSFDELLTNIENKTAGLGGYVERMEVSNGSRGNRYAYYVVRIPEAVLNNFTETVSEESNVTSRNCSVEDVTLSYVDMQSRKEVLLAEEENLMEMLRAAEDIETMLMVEARLSEVRSNREAMESQLRAYDNDINYSTVYIDINEVKVFTVVEEEEESTWTKITKGFGNSLENLKEDIVDAGIDFVVNLPYIILDFVLLILAWLILRLLFGIGKKKFMKAKAKYDAKRNAAKVSDDAENGDNKEVMVEGQSTEKEASTEEPKK